MTEANDTREPTAAPATDPIGELEPIRRDRGFLFRLVAALLVGGIAATFIGYKMQHYAAGCGAGLVQPGSTVVPPSASH